MPEVAFLEKDRKTSGAGTQSQPASKVPASSIAANKLILLGSGKGGSGKTTFSSNFAAAAAGEGRRVALVDLDSQQTLAKWWSRRPDDLPGMDCFAGRLSDPMDTIQGLTNYDVIIVDTPPGLDDFPSQTKALIRRADFVLIPTGVSRFDTESVSEFMATVQALGTSAAFVLSRVNRRAKSFLEAKHRLNLAGGRLCAIEVPSYEDFFLAAENGVSVVEIRGAKGVDDMLGVWAYVKKEIGL